ncbi:hypothetical protein [Idiomarina xiamenensis]|uniref:Uncharacterized protein n=1 Tax=Idiomarina xiamenensis 10-D-4 TaxID=740709 RepID=K2KGG3_9GAMM|nr:hypothetical protein [Idiomarina xiamenensis]EKE87078.1 hypothetical protein A10D4_02522 [Idiomarina xiamenensis 10-D-4]
MTIARGINNKLPWLPTLYRWTLAALGGFALTVCLSVFIPELTLWLWNWSKATVLMWMLLLSFAIYSALFMWVIATRRLLRTSVIMLVSGLLLYVAIEGLQGADASAETVALVQLQPMGAQPC